MNLITLGIGAIIGAGIFVLTGQAAAQYAGPGIMLSYVIAGTGCAFAGLCYAEFASMIPIAGSAYTYGYATLGEIFAWIIGWDLILEYAFGAATVASGWSSTLVAFLQDYGINLPPQICDVPGAKWSMVDGRWAPDVTLSTDQMVRATQHTTTIFNFMAFFAIIAVTTLLIVGIKESANFNTTIVFVKLIAVIVFIIVAGMYVIKQPDVAHANWHPCSCPRTPVLWARSDGPASCAARVSSSSLISGLTPSQPPLRKPRIRRRTCPSASLARSSSVRCFTSWSLAS